MKKFLSIALVLIMSLCFASCGEKAAEMDEEKVKEATEAMQSIYNANRTVLLMQNHKSVSYTIDNYLYKEKEAALEPGEEMATTSKDAINYVSYCYETPDSAYTKTSSTVWYRKADRVSYQYNYTNGELATKVYHASFVNNYTPYMFSIVPELEMDWFDDNHEKFTGFSEENGEIHLTIEKDDVASQYYIEDTLYFAYQKELVSTEIVCDAKTYEIKSITYKNIAGEEAKELYKITAEYDKAEPEEARLMREDFENPNVKKNNVLFCQNPKTSKTPGSTAEMRIEFKANAGYSIKYQADPSVSYSAYTDPECTKAVVSGSWDKQSDIERYIVTKAK